MFKAPIEWSNGLVDYSPFLRGVSQGADYMYQALGESRSKIQHIDGASLGKAAGAILSGIQQASDNEKIERSKLQEAAQQEQEIKVRGEIASKTLIDMGAMTQDQANNLSPRQSLAAIAQVGQNAQIGAQVTKNRQDQINIAQQIGQRQYSQNVIDAMNGVSQEEQRQGPIQSVYEDNLRQPQGPISAVQNQRQAMGQAPISPKAQQSINNTAGIFKGLSAASKDTINTINNMLGPEKALQTGVELAVSEAKAKNVAESEKPSPEVAEAYAKGNYNGYGLSPEKKAELANFLKKNTNPVTERLAKEQSAGIMMLSELKDMHSLVEEYGNYEFVNSDVSAKLDQSVNELGNLYTKIVDPTEGFKDYDLKNFQSMLEYGFFTRDSRTKSQLKQLAHFVIKKLVTDGISVPYEAIPFFVDKEFKQKAIDYNTAHGIKTKAQEAGLVNNLDDQDKSKTSIPVAEDNGVYVSGGRKFKVKDDNTIVELVKIKNAELIKNAGK